MYRESLSNWGLLWLVFPLPALTLLMVAILVPAVPVLLIIAIGAIGYAVLSAAIVGAKMAEREDLTSASRAGLELELMDTVPLTVAPGAFGVARTIGRCALGFQPGHSWVIDRGGHLSPQICRPAVEALSALIQAPGQDGGERQFSCRCPLGMGPVVFSLRQDTASGVH